MTFAGLKNRAERDDIIRYLYENSPKGRKKKKK